MLLVSPSDIFNLTVDPQLSFAEPVVVDYVDRDSNNNIVNCGTSKGTMTNLFQISGPATGTREIWHVSVAHTQLSNPQFYVSAQRSDAGNNVWNLVTELIQYKQTLMYSLQRGWYILSINGRG